MHYPKKNSRIAYFWYYSLLDKAQWHMSSQYTHLVEILGNVLLQTKEGFWKLVAAAAADMIHAAVFARSSAVEESHKKSVLKVDICLCQMRWTLADSDLQIDSCWNKHDTNQLPANKSVSSSPIAFFLSPAQRSCLDLPNWIWMSKVRRILGAFI